MGTETAPSFSVVDYILFLGSLLASAGIGIYFAVCGGRQKSTKEVLLGNKELGIFPVAMSLLATFMSAISLLGYPAEIYSYGTMLCWYGVMYIVAYPLAAYLFLPVFYNLELTSAYEYLELRFDRSVRLMASLTFCLQILLYMAVVLYAPALALSSVTPLSMTASILTTGLLAAFYTSIGGAKAVVYTSTVQMVLIIIGLLTVVISGFVFHGGLTQVWEAAERGNRIQFTDFRVDPRVRHSVWSLMIGGTFTLLTLYGANQMTIQKYVSMRSLKEAQIALIINVPVNQVALILFTFIGLILYAEFGNCDPRVVEAISKPDQLLPYFVMQRLSMVYGLPGLFVAALYGAGLSTLSGGFNSVAAVVYEDFVKPTYHWKTGGEIEDGKGAWVCKVLAVVFGGITIGMAFLFNLLKSTVLQIALSIFGMAGGPLLGAFCLGMFFPWANKWGALAGQIVSLTVSFWTGFGALANKMAPVGLPTGSNCSLANHSISSSLSVINESVSGALELPADFGRVHSLLNISGGVMEWYSISYQYYSLLGVTVLLVVGLIVSMITGATDPRTVDARLLIPAYDKLCCCCPRPLRNFFMCGVPWDSMKSRPTTTALLGNNENKGTFQEVDKDDFEFITISGEKDIPLKIIDSSSKSFRKKPKGTVESTDKSDKALLPNDV